MANPILRITNGTDTVDLLGVNSGLILSEWRPSIPSAKGGGVYRDSVMSDGKQLLMRRFSNAVETFSLRAHGGSQDTIIAFTQDLLRLLQQGVDYWENRWIDTPVWIEARGSSETETRYAIINNYSVDTMDNPYSQPFFGCEPGMETLNVAVERNHWMSTPPTDPLCTPLIGDPPTSVDTEVEDVREGDSDGYVKDTLGAEDYSFWRTDTVLKIGIESDTDEYISFMRFDFVDIPQGAVINSAYIQLDLAVAHAVSNDMKVNIYVEDNIDPTTFSTYADFAQRRFYSVPVEELISGSAKSPGDDYVLDVTALVQYIVDQSSWTIANAMSFKIEFIVPLASGAIWEFAAYEHSTWDEPRLVAYYAVNDYEVDQCQSYGEPLAFKPSSGGNESEVFISPRYNKTGLTHIYHYDDSLTTWSNNLLTTTPPYELFPASPAVDDIVYFGSDQVAYDGGAFFGLVFDFISGFGSGTTIQWEVWLAAPTSTWHQFLLTTFPAYIDNTNQLRGQFRGLGVDQEHQRLEGRSVHWKSMQGDAAAALHGSWVESSVNSVTAYWVRAIITAYDSGNVEVNSHPYAPMSPKISFNNGDIKGDIPALARARFWYEGYVDETVGGVVNCQATKILLGARTRHPHRDTKPGFSAYIPFQDTFEQAGVESIGFTAEGSYVDHSGASNGRCVLLNPAGATTMTLTTTLDLGVFRGRYRVFVRASVSGGTGTDVDAYILVGGLWGADYISETVNIETKDTNEDPNWFVIDFGLLDMPAGGKADLPDNDSVGITLEFIVASGAPNVYVESLILMPADEWIGEVSVDHVNIYSGIETRLQYIAFDSISDFREDFVPVMGEINEYSYVALSERVKGKSAGSFVVPPNTDIDYWFLPIGHDVSGGVDHYYSYPQMDFKARIDIFERYQAMRGAR